MNTELAVKQATEQAKRASHSALDIIYYVNELAAQVKKLQKQRDQLVSTGLVLIGHYYQSSVEGVEHDEDVIEDLTRKHLLVVADIAEAENRAGSESFAQYVSAFKEALLDTENMSLDDKS